MELTGKVILDNESKKELTEELRKEIIEEIKENGHTSREIKSFMKDLDMVGYLNVLKDTIDDVINNNINDYENKNMFSDDYKRYRKLLAIKNILDI